MRRGEAQGRYGHASTAARHLHTGQRTFSTKKLGIVWARTGLEVITFLQRNRKEGPSPSSPSSTSGLTSVQTIAVFPTAPPSPPRAPGHGRAGSGMGQILTHTALECSRPRHPRHSCHIRYLGALSRSRLRNTVLRDDGTPAGTTQALLACTPNLVYS